MNRVISNQRLKILIQTNQYLKQILQSCESSDQLEARITCTNVLKSTCLTDIKWKEIYVTLKEGTA